MFHISNNTLATLNIIKDANTYISKINFSPKLLIFIGIIRLLKKITEFFVFKFK